jgi:hypothetical protein
MKEKEKEKEKYRTKALHRAVFFLNAIRLVGSHVSYISLVLIYAHNISFFKAIIFKENETMLLLIISYQTIEEKRNGFFIKYSTNL